MSIKNTDFKEELDILFKAILKLENEDECYKFFEDIATINELKSLAQRMQVAKMLKEKKVYTEIAEVTGASTATISRVNKCLNYGEEGYNLVLDSLYPKSKQLDSCKKIAQDIYYNSYNNYCSKNRYLLIILNR